MPKNPNRGRRNQRAGRQARRRPVGGGFRPLGAPIFQSPLKDIQAMRYGISHYKAPSREVWAWLASSVVLMVLLVWQGGFLINVLLRITVIGGGFRLLAEQEKHRRAGKVETDLAISWGCAIPLVLLFTLFLFVFFGWIWMTFDLE